MTLQKPSAKPVALEYRNNLIDADDIDKVTKGGHGRVRAEGKGWPQRKIPENRPKTCKPGCAEDNSLKHLALPQPLFLVVLHVLNSVQNAYPSL